MKTIIEIFDDLTPEQEHRLVKFIDDFITTQFMVHREDYSVPQKENKVA